MAPRTVADFIKAIDPTDVKLIKLGELLLQKGISLKLFKLACHDEKTALTLLPTAFKADEETRRRVAATLFSAVERSRDGSSLALCVVSH